MFVEFLYALWQRMIDLIIAPAKNKEMLWMAIPLVTVLLLMEFYYGRYAREEVGWNTAFGNSLVLLFVSLDLFRHLYENYGLMFFASREIYFKYVLAGIILLIGFWLMVMNFFHELPKKIAFFIGSELPINVLAYSSLAIVYTNIKLDLITLLAITILFFVLYGLFELIHLIEPKAE